MSNGLEKKVQERLVYEGFGFPAVLIHVPMVRVRGEWTPDVDFNEIARRLLEVLAHLPVRLTGNQIKFIRHSFSMTLEQFADRLGVTHPAVIKWESAGKRPTMMSWAVEKDIRLEILQRVLRTKGLQFAKAYIELTKVPAASKGERVRLEVGKSA